MNKPVTIVELLKNKTPDAPAIGAPSRSWLSYGQLTTQVDNTVKTLNKLGIGRNQRVAIVLPNGPEMAVAFIAIAAGATAAPLNPGYKYDEFKYYLQDLGAKALLVAAGKANQAAADAASELNIPVLELSFDAENPAGIFELTAAADSQAGLQANLQVGASKIQTGYAQSDDIAMVLHTSGTTSRPKIVPLSQQNVCSSAFNVQQTLALSTNDVGLVVMPLFHIHGLIAAILAPVTAGGAVFCSPGFNALKFFSWMEEANPTWYTAVPTMHQTILARAKANLDIIKKHPLRFIRSSSSALPPPVIRELEEQFGTALIESYGMTEAAHQMASNPLPPQLRKPGSVGIAAGPDVGIMNLQGEILPADETGEIVIRGDNVTRGYENNPTANAEAFTHGWFRTGDQGVIDAEGYLSITGRLKEIINRGGEKISPREIDDVLMEHPSIEQVVTFAIPHATLGEEVGAAIVLKPDTSLSNKELKEYASERLAAYKVPKTVVFLEEIPKGATGKLQRIGLAEKLGLTPAK